MFYLLDYQSNLLQKYKHLYIVSCYSIYIYYIIFIYVAGGGGITENRALWLVVVLSQYWELGAHTSGGLTSTLGHPVILCVFRFKASFALFNGTVQN